MASSKTTEPLPCPFCGEVPAVNTHTFFAPPIFWNEKGWVIECVNPNCPERPASTLRSKKEDAIDAWNGLIESWNGPRGAVKE